MKKTFKKVICASLVLVMLCVNLTSCKNGEPIFSYGDVVMNENMFSYHLSDNKTYYLLGIGATGDSEEFWNMKASQEGKTVGDMAFDSIVKNAREIVASAYLYEETKKAAEDKSAFNEADIQIEKQIDTLVDQLTKSKGSRSALEEYLSGYGINLENLRAYYTLYFKMAALQGSVTVSEQEKEDYFGENYSVVKHILVNTSFKVRDDGSKVSLTEEEKAEKVKLSQEINTKLLAGESFEELWEVYKDSDASGAAKYYEGYFVGPDSSFTKEFQQAALDMEVGEIRMVESTYGIHIIKKYPTDAKKYNLYSDVEAELIQSISTNKFNSLVEAHIENVETNAEVLAKYNIVNAPILN